MKRFARLAAFGALGVAGGAAALYLLIALGSTHTATSGIDQTNATLVWIGAGVPIAGVVAAHVAYARHLLKYAKEQQT